MVNKSFKLKVKEVKAVLSSQWKPISELQGVACHLGSHNVTCHPTQTNAPCLNLSRWMLVLDLPTLPGRDGRL